MLQKLNLQGALVKRVVPLSSYACSIGEDKACSANDSKLYTMNDGELSGASQTHLTMR